MVGHHEPPHAPLGHAAATHQVVKSFHAYRFDPDAQPAQDSLVPALHDPAALGILGPRQYKQRNKQRAHGIGKHREKPEARNQLVHLLLSLPL